MEPRKTCHQYEIRIQNRKEDLELAGFTEEDIVNLKASDFVYSFEQKEDCYKEVSEFITRHEWLGSMCQNPTHIFTARYNNILAGTVVMGVPYAFSYYLGRGEPFILSCRDIDIGDPDTDFLVNITVNGKDKEKGTKRIERLIGRGACISWSPKNLATKLNMYAIKWMVKNTRFRIFIGYTDSEAGEVGTIYQASNFYFLGSAGVSKQYFNNGKWVSDKSLRSRSAVKRVSKLLDIEWNPEWNNGDKVLWKLIPNDIAVKFKTELKSIMNSLPSRKAPAKSKYIYIQGKSPTETRVLRNLFKANNKIQPYPKRKI